MLFTFKPFEILTNSNQHKLQAKMLTNILFIAAKEEVINIQCFTVVHIGFILIFLLYTHILLQPETVK